VDTGQASRKVAGVNNGTPLGEWWMWILAGLWESSWLECWRVCGKVGGVNTGRFAMSESIAQLGHVTSLLRLRAAFSLHIILLYHSGPSFW
jgi:hypothetical protein